MPSSEPTPPPGTRTDPHAHSTELHLPHGSWWPFWLANSIALFLVGQILVGRALDLRGAGSVVPMPLAFTVLGLGAAAVIASLLGWFRQDVHWWDERLGTGEHVPKAGILLFIGSEIFLFGALFTVYFSLKRLSGGHWPDAEVELPLRSEERRVGKECRSRWSP